MLTAEYLHECFKYDPDTGELVWKWRPIVHFPTMRSYRIWNVRFANEPAGSKSSSDGYFYVRVDKTLHSVHRLVFVLMTGRWPAHEIDHKNNIRTDNRWENLREATRSQNSQNCGVSSNNAVGLKGVSWSKAREAWVAEIMADHVRHRLGYFNCPAAAFFAYQVAADKLHGNFAKVF